MRDDDDGLDGVGSSSDRMKNRTPTGNRRDRLQFVRVCCGLWRQERSYGTVKRWESYRKIKNSYFFKIKNSTIN